MNNIHKITQGQYIIGDVGFCKESSRTIDIKFFDLANNEKVLDLLGLYYLQGNYGVRHTYESRGKWFYGYINSFSKHNYDYLLNNSEVRLLIEDENLLQKLKKIYLT